ncbi:MAG: hypothetical protein JO227_05305 [Acetobacteraceae bacterium]|nr:hypothetical protein [Acetobacteraceae bacterium]
MDYEELATVAKRLSLSSKAEIDERLPEIRSEFTKVAGQWTRTIAAYGSGINRKLRIPNRYAVNREIRDQFSLAVRSLRRFA